MELRWAIPGAQLEKYVERVEVLSVANTILNKFHGMRKRDVGGGQAPTIQESLAKFMAQ